MSADKPMILYRITIELACEHETGNGVTLQFTGETLDLRAGDVKPSNFEATTMAANILQFHAQQASEFATDERTFNNNQRLMQMPTSGKPC